jgi:hypothetical protein
MKKARARNRFWVLLLLAAVLCVQAAPLASAHFHSHSARECCWLCHVGTLPFLQSADVSSTPTLAMVWLDRPAGLGAPRAARLAADSSRAPPA